MAVLIGNNAASGQGTTFFPDDSACISSFVAAASGTVDTLSAWTSGNAGDVNVTLLIYADSAGSPGALLGQSVLIVGGVADTVISGAMVSNVAVVAATTYWLGFHVSSSGSQFNSRWFASGGFRYDDGYATPPDPWDMTGNSTGTEGLAIQGDGTLAAAASPPISVARSNLRLG
jgi:hypothetical protein